MFLSHLTLCNFRQFGGDNKKLELSLSPGVTALVGRNDSGKSAVIDAIRYALLTRDQNYIRVQPEDFHIDELGNQSDEIIIRCRMSNLNDDEKGAFAEYLTYVGAEVFLMVNWSARRRSASPSAHRWVDVSVRSGVDGTGPTFEASVREQLSSTYLRPLRDAEREMSSGRGSRLSQILANVMEVSMGEAFDEENPPDDPSIVSKLSLLGLADYLRHSMKSHEGLRGAETTINTKFLSSLFLDKDSLESRINLTEGGSESIRLRRILERLELSLLEASSSFARGDYGLGSNNILYMACELLLLGREPELLPLLLIEEPEAHLHPQRQLRLMDFLSSAAAGKAMDSPRAVQVVLSTHSPNLASMIPLGNLIMLDGGRAYSLAEGKTKLENSDYQFLERVLDVTKANLFFAHGILIVEGIAEALLLPTLARLMGFDLTKYGVSIVNVSGTGLRRFSRIFQRSVVDSGLPSVRVACVTDMDVMPNCAPAILGLVTGDDDDKWNSTSRRWKAKRDFGVNSEPADDELAGQRKRLCASDGQSVHTFVADHWTLEYDLSFFGLAEEVYVAARLAKEDEAIMESKKTRTDVEADAKTEFSTLEAENSANREALCSHVYKLFHSGKASKAIAAQYLANALATKWEKKEINPLEFAKRLPPYLVAAIVHATGVENPTLTTASGDPLECTDD
jgi:putative ATP-dependent endonuclease of OLD family